MASEVARFADRVDVDAVGDLAGHAQHPRVDGGDVDLRVGRFDRTWAPLRVEERQLVELAVVVERLATESGEARLHGEDVVAQAWTGSLELDAVPANDVGAYLRAEPEPERSARGFLQLPRGLGGDHRAARERHGHTGRQFEPGRGDGGRGGRRVRRAPGLGEQHAVEAGRRRSERRTGPSLRSGRAVVITSTRMARP